VSDPRRDVLRVLLIEDEPANRALVRAIIARADRATVPEVDLVEAATMADARSMLAGGSFDAVLVDVRLPDGNGLDLIGEIREREREVKVIVVSASVLPAERASALATGADGFLAKPFGAEAFVDVLRAVRGP
jgi:two-component system, OmpR family, KDP operon response regulator KdpE